MKTLTPLQHNTLLTLIRSVIKNFNCIFDADLAVEPLPRSCGYGLYIYLSTKAERWAVKMARRARNAANCGEATIQMGERVTVVSVHEFKSIGTAICAPGDKYDPDLGLAIAYARAMGEVIPDYVL